MRIPSIRATASLVSGSPGDPLPWHLQDANKEQVSGNLNRSGPPCHLEQKQSAMRGAPQLSATSCHVPLWLFDILLHQYIATEVHELGVEDEADSSHLQFRCPSRPCLLCNCGAPSVSTVAHMPPVSHVHQVRCVTFPA